MSEAGATYSERTAHLKGILTAGKAILAQGLDEALTGATEASLGVYGGIGRPTPEPFSVFSVRWSERNVSIQAFSGGKLQKGTSIYRIILQAKVLGLEAAEQTALALDVMSENLNTLLQPHSVEAGFWTNGQLGDASSDIRPNVNAALNTVDYSQWWQTQTWTFAVDWQRLRS